MPIRNAPFQTRFRTVDDIKRYLTDNFAPICIQQNETVEDAHRRAGQVEVAQRIIATIEREDAPDLADYLED